jgi:hypothetical protein
MLTAHFMICMFSFLSIHIEAHETDQYTCHNCVSQGYCNVMLCHLVSGFKWWNYISSYNVQQGIIALGIMSLMQLWWHIYACLSVSICKQAHHHITCGFGVLCQVVMKFPDFLLVAVSGCSSWLITAWLTCNACGCLIFVIIFQHYRHPCI